MTRLSRAMSPTALIVSALALALAGAGVGWTAASIGTDDLQNGAVTSPKVKDRSLKNADLVKEERFRTVGGTGVDFADGGDGDCVWFGYNQVIPNGQGPAYRIDRSGVVHLIGIAIADDAPGGDGTCGNESPEDGVVLRLPAKYVPAHTQFSVTPNGSSLYVIGKGGLEGLPAGAVYTDGTSAVLQDTSFPAASSDVSDGVKPIVNLGARGRAVLRRDGILR